MAFEGIEMPQELARKLLVEGGTLIVLNVPPGTDFGIDIKSWNTEENFKGIKMIPPGFHFIHYSAVNEFGDMAPRIGFFHIFKKSEFLVKQWDKDTEDISAESVPEEMVQTFKDNLKNLEKFLGPYPYDTWQQWNELTSQITPSIVTRCSPVCGFVYSALELESCSDASRPRGGEPSKKRKRGGGLSVEEKEENLLPELKPKPGTELRLTELPEQHYPDGATPAEVTKHSLDSTYILDTLEKKMDKPMDVVGELQLAFICFLAGQSLDAFEHWKKLVTLLCRVDSGIPSRFSIYMEFLKTLEAQIKHVPEEILCDIVASNNVVYHNLRKLFANIEINTEVDDRLKCYSTRMRDRLKKKFLWDFSDLQEEEDDEAPVVVYVE
ncbi:protein AAR2 homolog [Prorops nasuta]|uniref:protein AAR2 homolog n=1 Tax=Prorops nasuta TaxID=863751 RepID=UPI0034CD0260